MVPALEIASSLIEFGKSDVMYRVLAYSDGCDSDSLRGDEVSAPLKANDVLIETFGVADSPEYVDEDFLKNVATTDPNGFVHYRFLGDNDTLQETFSNLATGMLTVDD